ncbi:rCG26285 [Rattus norvegicus]|uniref:RCG26285 n=1 Tax=Rattus norvegicus TaxID=10116 RepID=A6HPA0_RAT|nr:rCG26285 [Rattus norvegicus]
MYSPKSQDSSSLALL